MGISLHVLSVSFCPCRHALLFGSQKINLHQHGKEFEPKAQNVMPGSADLCFLTDHPVEEVLKALKADNIDVCHRAQATRIAMLTRGSVGVGGRPSCGPIWCSRRNQKCLRERP